MASSPKYETGRTAEYSARNYLLEQGYEVVRVVGRSGKDLSLLNLVAWNRSTVLFICVRSLRLGYNLKGDITGLSGLFRTGRYPGDIQYWIRERDRWRRYRICSWGAVQMPGSS